jgi:rhomboid protease GluP
MQDFLERLNRATPTTWVTHTLIGVNVVVFVVAAALGVSMLSPRADQLLALGGNFLPYTLQQPWRLVTAMFLHAGIIHIGFNMWALRDLGQIAERFYGNWQYLVIYATSGVFASLASLYFSASEAVSVGASGAIFGVAGAILAAVLTKPRMLPAPLVVHMRRSMFIFVGYALFMGFTVPVIDNSAHVGGLVSGFLMATLMSERFDWDDFQANAWRSALLAVAGALVAGTVLWRLVPAPAP